MVQFSQVTCTALGRARTQSGQPGPGACSSTLALVLWLYHSLALSFHKRDISAQKSGGTSRNKSNSLNFNLFSSIKNSLFYSLLAEIFVNIITDLHGPTKQALISTIREYLDKYNIKVKLKHFQCRNI